MNNATMMNQAIQPVVAWAVNPAFFWAGAALVAIPLVIHFLNRRRFRVVNWAAMEYLLQAMRKNRRRLKFEQWLLLATRCLVLGLLGLALARPLGCADSRMGALAGQRTGLHFFVIDNSYSMAYEANRPGAATHLDQARNLAEELIGRLSPGGESVVVITAGRPAEALLATPTYDLQAARRAVEQIEQSSGGTDLAGALQKALEIAREETRQPMRRLYVLTDGTRSAWEGDQSEALRQLGPQLADQFRVTHFNLGLPEQWNHAVLDVRPSAGLVTTRFPVDFIAEARGFGPGPDALLRWRLDGQQLPGGGMLELDPQTPPQTQSQAQLRTGGPHVITAELVSDGRLEIDNVRHRVVNVMSELRVLIVEGQRGIGPMAGSGSFLETALAPVQEGTRRSSSYVRPERISDIELPGKVLRDYGAVILAGVGQVQPSQADQLRTFVEQGGSLMLFMGERVDGDHYNQTLLPRGLLPGTLTQRQRDPRGFRFDFPPTGPAHPFLDVFEGQEASGLDRARVEEYWQIELAEELDDDRVRVLNYARTEGGGYQDPAITVHPLGRGQVVFVSTSANTQWTTFPGRPAYVALVHELLSGSVSSGDEWLNLTVGESVRIPPEIRLTATPELTDPAGEEIVLERGPDEGAAESYRSRPIIRPGLYRLSTGERTIPIAVNVPADEADVRTIDNRAIQGALGGIEIALEADQVPAVTAERDLGRDLGWTIMVLVLGLVAVECFMAMRFGHYRRR